jgi:hypothetical protein
MAEEFVKNDPPVVGRVLCSLEGVDFGRVNEGAPTGFVPFGTHAVCYYYVLETELVTDVIVLCNRLAASRYIEPVHIHLVS